MPARFGGGPTLNKEWRMRRSPTPLLAGLLAGGLLAGGLGGCQRYAGSPLVGFGPFIAGTHSTDRPDDALAGRDETMRHAQGFSSSIDPLLPEPGNVWPGPLPPDKSLNDIQREQNSEQARIDQAAPAPPPPAAPRRQPRGSSTPPGSVQTSPSEPPAAASPGIVAPQIRPGPAPLIGKNGPLIPDRNNGSGIGTATTPGQAGQSILVPNGNGTTTVIGPDGSTQVVPTPK